MEKSLYEYLEPKAWESYEKARFLWHVCPLSAMKSILRKGLVGKPPEEEDEIEGTAIFFFTDKRYADLVARSVGYDPYILLRIRKKAIERDSILWDFVGESYTVCSFYCLKDHIPASELHFQSGPHWLPEITRVKYY